MFKTLLFTEQLALLVELQLEAFKLAEGRAITIYTFYVIEKGGSIVKDTVELESKIIFWSFDTLTDKDPVVYDTTAVPVSISYSFVSDVIVNEAVDTYQLFLIVDTWNYMV